MGRTKTKSVKKERIKKTGHTERRERQRTQMGSTETENTRTQESETIHDTLSKFDLLAHLHGKEQALKERMAALAEEKTRLLPDYTHHEDGLKELTREMRAAQDDLETLHAAILLGEDQQRDQEAWKKWQAHRGQILDTLALLVKEKEKCRKFTEYVQRLARCGDELIQIRYELHRRLQRAVSFPHAVRLRNALADEVALQCGWLRPSMDPSPGRFPLQPLQAGGISQELEAHLQDPEEEILEAFGLDADTVHRVLTMADDERLNPDAGKEDIAAPEESPADHEDVADHGGVEGAGS